MHTILLQIDKINCNWWWSFITTVSGGSIQDDPQHHAFTLKWQRYM